MFYLRRLIVVITFFLNRLEYIFPIGSWIWGMSFYIAQILKNFVEFLFRWFCTIETTACHNLRFNLSLNKLDFILGLGLILFWHLNFLWLLIVFHYILLPLIQFIFLFDKHLLTFLAQFFLFFLNNDLFTLETAHLLHWWFALWQYLSWLINELRSW